MHRILILLMINLTLCGINFSIYYDNWETEIAPFKPLCIVSEKSTMLLLDLALHHYDITELPPSSCGCTCHTGRVGGRGRGSTLGWRAPNLVWTHSTQTGTAPDQDHGVGQCCHATKFLNKNAMVTL